MLNFGVRFLICNAFICLLIGVITALKQLLKKYLSAQIQYNFWLVLLVLLAVPFLPTDVPGFLRIFSWSGCTKSTMLNSNSKAQHRALIDQNYAMDKMNDFAVSISSKTPSVINILILTIWALGIIVMVILTFRSLRQLHILEKSALPLQSQKVKCVWKQCLSEMNIKKTIPVYSTAFLKSPITVGFFRPRIYIPIHLISDFHPKNMRFMLLHELQHCRRKDTLIGIFMNIAGIVYWFNPLIWYALKEMRCDREIACDSAVLQILCEKDYEAYGNTLINLAEKISLSPFPFAMRMGGSMKQMKRRVLNIAGFRKQTLFKKVRGIIVYTFITALLLGCAPALSIYASVPGKYQFNEKERHISHLDLNEYFQEYDGSFVLYDTYSNLWSIYNIDAARKRITPNSTYKIYDALLGLESGIITANSSKISWNGDDYPFDSWEADQDLTSAMHNSVNWYFQSIDSQVGLNSVKSFLQDIGYGNQITSSDLDLYWTDFSLKISPIEQIELLQKFHDNKFRFAPENIDAVKDAIHLASTTEGSFYGKTGTGRVDDQDVNGWFIGYIEKSDHIYYFATNIQGDSETTGNKAAEITDSILSELQIWN
ncbi:regulatory protein BlaR1 [Lachnospiraceae bacterium]|nr:regulatory protein BlaR1 [Lachnospiraceae bacterium]